MPPASTPLLQQLRAWVQALCRLSSAPPPAPALAPGLSAAWRQHPGGGLPPAPPGAAAAGTAFGESDMFAGYCVDTLPTLLLLHTSQQQHLAAAGDDVMLDPACVLSACKSSLLLCATADGMARAASSVQLQPGTSAEAWDFAELAQAYLVAPCHSIHQFLTAQAQQYGVAVAEAAASGGAPSSMEVDNSGDSACMGLHGDDGAAGVCEEEEGHPPGLTASTPHCLSAPPHGLPASSPPPGLAGTNGHVEGRHGTAVGTPPLPCAGPCWFITTYSGAHVQLRGLLQAAGVACVEEHQLGSFNNEV